MAWIDFLPELTTVVPSHRFRLSIYRMLGAKIGEHTSIHRGCQFYHLPGLEISSHSVVNQKVILDARRGLRIGSNVSISEQDQSKQSFIPCTTIWMTLISRPQGVRLSLKIMSLSVLVPSSYPVCTWA